MTISRSTTSSACSPRHSRSWASTASSAWTGKSLIGLFDTNPQDCTISIEEVRDNSLIVSLFAPDVTVEGVSALSVGVGVHAVVGAFTQP